MFKADFVVRDSEIDAQGVVNNANYMVYMEHCRHEFLKSIGVNFAEYTSQKKMLYLISSEITYKKSLVSDNKFYVTCELSRQGRVRFVFTQQVIRDDGVLMAEGINKGVCMDLNVGKPFVPDEFKDFV